MNDKQLNGRFGDLAASPRMYPEEIDFERRVVHFCRMNRETYARSSFLDDRKVRIDHNNYEISLNYLLNHFGSPDRHPSAINWIFHTPHSGSTLIARAIDGLKGSFVLKEPILLIQSSSLKRHPDYIKWEQSRDWHRFFTMVQELLSRTFISTDTALIKSTSVCHNLVSDIFSSTRPARGLFLYSSLEKFLTSLYKRNYLDAYLKAGFHGALHDLRPLNIIEPDKAEQISRHRKAALLWLSVVFSLNKYISENPDKKIITLDCQQFFSEREATLLSLAGHFGYSCDITSIKTIVNGPIFSRDAKSGERIPDESAVLERNKRVRKQYKMEIDDALTWAEKLASTVGHLYSAPVFNNR